MTSKFEFLVDKTLKTMTIKQAYAAPRQLVWDCHSKSDLLDKWFAPKPYTTKSKSMNFQNGGHWHYAMVAPDGLEHFGRLDFHDVKPIESYKARSIFCDDKGEAIAGLPVVTWNVSFTEDAGVTHVTNVISYETAEGLQQVIDMGMQEGIAATVAQLVELVEGVK